MKYLMFIYRMPMWFIILCYQLYVTYMIVKDSDPQDLESINTEEDLAKHLKPHVDKFYTTYRVPLNIFTIIFWLSFIKIVW